MPRELLLEIFHKWLILDLVLLLLSFIISWLVVLKLGFKILKAEVSLKKILLGALVGTLVSLFKPFLLGIINFFITMLPMVFFLKSNGKTKWIIACWVTFLLILTTAIGPILIISPLAGSSQTLTFFFHDTIYGRIISVLIETLVPAILLMLLKVFNVSLIPSPGKRLTNVDFVDIYLFFALLFWCYKSTMRIWEGVGNILYQAFIILAIEWTLAAGAVVGFYIKKVNTQKKLEHTMEMYQSLKESKIDPQELNDFSDKLLKTLNPNTDIDFPPYIVSLPEIKFTRREQDVIRLIEQGYNNDEIAQEICVVPGRVANIISDIISKTGLSDRKLTVYAMYWVRKNKK